MHDQILGWIATILTTAPLVPQIIKTIVTKRSNDVSLAMVVFYLTGNIVALMYAFAILQWPLIIKYAVSILLGLIYLYLFFAYFQKMVQKHES